MRQVIVHPWKVSTKEAKRIQEDLRSKLRLKNGFRKISRIAGVDTSFHGDWGYGTVAVFSYQNLELVEEVVVRGHLIYPYVPGLLSFREGPVLLKALEKVKNEPDILLVDGQGIAHPRGLGLASHLGILLNKPSIGCAKSLLVGEYEEPHREKGSTSPLYYNGRRVGSVVRTRRDVKPLFVSPGHHIDIKTSVEIVLQCCKRFRLPEPIRWADQASRKAKWGYRGK